MHLHFGGFSFIHYYIFFLSTWDVTKYMNKIYLTVISYSLYKLWFHMNKISLVLRPKEEKGPGFSHLRMHLIVVEVHHLCVLLIYLWPHVDTKCYIVCRFIIAAYMPNMQETHTIVLIQWLIWSYKRKVQASLESADEKKRLLTNKSTAIVNLGFHALHFRPPFLLEIFTDNQRKAVGQGAEIKVTQASYLRQVW